jgi:putative cardiolipin synthase
MEFLKIMPIRGLALALVASLALAGCSGLPSRPELPEQAAAPAATDTALDELIGRAEAAHPGQSGFRLLREGPEAFMIRSRSALLAGRSLDVQTYIWHADDTGAFLAHRVLEAADRGVKVRLLVDDLDARSRHYGYAALAAHPNIDVRMFNPFGSRTGSMRYAFEAMGSFSRINRRMHNKTWIVDNRIAIVGGRNLGDEYFGASDEVNFVDLDFAMVGPIVREASASFDRYWNSPAAYPMQLLDAAAVSAEALAQLRQALAGLMPKVATHPYAQELRDNDSVQRMISGDWPMHWTAHYRFVSDDPAKALGKNAGLGGSRVLEAIAPELRGAEHRITVISPYFVPGREGTQYLVQQADRGVDVQVLTNSLAANDVAVVYGGYSKYRPDLLRGGVQLWELKPLPGSEKQQSLFGSSGASLHTKALATDSSRVFVGSYNLDPRSTSLNCEQGVFVDEAAVARQLESLFAQDSGADRAWAVTLVDGKLHWSDGQESFDSSPMASGGQKFQAWIARVLPLDSQL